MWLSFNQIITAIASIKTSFAIRNIVQDSRGGDNILIGLLELICVSNQGIEWRI
jgi:hypothetical protein